MAKREWKDGRCGVCLAEETKVVTVPKEPGSPRNETSVDMCEYCYRTLAGTAYWYPEQYPNSDTMEHVCKCMHLLEKRLLSALGA